MIGAVIIIGIIVLLLAVVVIVRHQQKLAQRAHLMEEAIRNRDFTFRLPTRGMFFGEQAMQKTLNQLGETIREQVNRNEVESWERLTRVLTHEIMNATAPITSISQSLLCRQDVVGSPLEEGIQAIYDTSRHLSDFVTNYRKMSELEKPMLEEVNIRAMVEDISRTYPKLTWEITLPSDLLALADPGMLRQIMINIVKNAVEASARKVVVETITDMSEGSVGGNQLPLYIGNDGLPIPAENRQSLFVPFFTTKRGGYGIGLSLSRRMMIQQGGMLDLVDKPLKGCHVGFLLSLRS
ncbi:MAG: HAMP domain-containing histidine kinase [Prevotella sp.]|nr:HAMP domain-containing histidine kinase [Prevotella sp.]